jgi:hypothetical protein
MQFARADLRDDLARLRASRVAPDRAVGDNFLFEERVCDERCAEFEGSDLSTGTLTSLQAFYFAAWVQGVRRDHVPTTFAAINQDALYRADIEPNQKIVRLECVDDVLRSSKRTFAELAQALQPRHRDENLIAHIVDYFALYPGARPAFVAFKSEVDQDLRQPDWLMRLRNRRGLGHYDPAPGQRQAFALMEYLAKDVNAEWQPLRARGAERPFAFPTVLDGKGVSPYSLPSPRNLPSSFAVDLSGPETKPIREMLHVRITYRPHHLVRVGELVGPLPPVKLAVARDGHLDRLRRQSGRVDFGAVMNGEVDE